MPHKIQHTYEQFPVFSGWPSNKVYFLENMAWEQHQDSETDDKKYVVITKDMEEGLMYNCAICTQKLCMVFHQDEEEWVFDNCKQYEGVVYHFPLCYEVGVEVKRRRSC